MRPFRAHQPVPRPPLVHRACLVALCLLVLPACGCSLVTMVGKMAFGDPLVEADFTRATGVSLLEEEITVLIVCSTPESVKQEFPSVNFDLLDGISRELKRRGIGIISPNDVATWMDENGGRFDNLEELATEFDPDYVIHIDLEELSHRELNSPTLYRGRALGNIYAYRVRRLKDAEDRFLDEIFNQEYRSTYPEHYPLSADQVSARSFGKKYLDRISLQIAQMFYDHKASEEQE